MNQEVRVILAVVLSAAIFMVYQTFFAPPMPQAPVEQPVATAQMTPETAQIQEAKKAEALIASESTRDESFTAEAREIKITTEKTAVLLNTKGGILTSYKLKEYQATAAKNAPTKDLLTETEGSYSQFFGLKGYDGLTEDSIYQVTREENLPQGGKLVELAWQDKNVRVERTLEFGGATSSYAIKQSYKIINRGEGNLLLTPYLKDRLRQKPVQANPNFFQKMSSSQPDTFHAQYYLNNKLTSDMDWNKFISDRAVGAVQWGGVADRYFLFANADGTTAPSQREAHFDREGDFLAAKFFGPEVGMKAGGEMSGSFFSYIGPKEVGELKKLPVPMKAAVDYGWFDFVAVPILWLMGTLRKVIPNWGLVIITLTFLVKMLLHPVNKKSMASMKAMQLLQPKLQEIKKRYPDDQQKQNEETMQLFRTHKVNPMGGCLPMLLQMPIYIALYKVLWNAIELYHAPFLWYRDLSAPDPYFVAPILLGIFMVLQQKLTPNPSADPAQKKMMMFMPIMFSVFMLFLPVGLVIYIFVNTMMSVIQQFMMQRDLSFKDLITGRWQANGA